MIVNTRISEGQPPHSLLLPLSNTARDKDIAKLFTHPSISHHSDYSSLS